MASGFWSIWLFNTRFACIPWKCFLFFFSAVIFFFSRNICQCSWLTQLSCSAKVEKLLFRMSDSSKIYLWKQPEQRLFKFNKDTGKLINSPGTRTVCRIKARGKGKANGGLDREVSCQSHTQTLLIGSCGKMSDHMYLVSFQLHAATMKWRLFTDLRSVYTSFCWELSCFWEQIEERQVAAYKDFFSKFDFYLCDVYVVILFLQRDLEKLI